MKSVLLFCLGGMLLAACTQNKGGRDKAATVVDKTTLGKGEELFKVNCAQCHQPDKTFVGPPLAGVETRWKNKANLYDFVRNPTEVIQRDKYAADLYEKWNESAMLPFPQLSDADIAAIFSYCEAEAVNGQ